MGFGEVQQYTEHHRAMDRLPPVLRPPKGRPSLACKGMGMSLKPSKLTSGTRSWEVKRSIHIRKAPVLRSGLVARAPKPFESGHRNHSPKQKPPEPGQSKQQGKKGVDAPKRTTDPSQERPVPTQTSPGLDIAPENTGGPVRSHSTGQRILCLLYTSPSPRDA